MYPKVSISYLSVVSVVYNMLNKTVGHWKSTTLKIYTYGRPWSNDIKTDGHPQKQHLDLQNRIIDKYKAF